MTTKEFQIYYFFRYLLISRYHYTTGKGDFLDIFTTFHINRITVISTKTKHLIVDLRHYHLNGTAVIPKSITAKSLIPFFTSLSIVLLST